MPAWWNKKGWSKDSDNSAKKRGKNFDNQKVNCFHEAHAPTISRAGDSSGFDSFDKGHPHPLPRPFNDQLHGGASGSGSVSSVSSSGSSDDHAAFRGHGENKLSRGSRCSTTPVSPLHARLGGMSLDSPGGKLEEGKSEFHKLPLPPGSPSSPSALPTPRSPGTTESSSYNASKWRQGKLLGRGTFVHVYLGFNSENGQMCAIKEVRLVSDDQSSKESLKQLNQCC
ncbi:mitogen-activated protein kinase kinase kinase 3-like isoform X2 [Salvia hispanica]|uniref:mitogen-activated protein kinase kinase kinase 3-like isoform X2 n=1 Tax=Salvia hispanica TaxID=49212 RepID=UPI0020092106|nr:mitogen-activated protein kinase kinase kinase 3-like isoform X2 [Salvia hispanica]